MRFEVLGSVRVSRDGSDIVLGNKTRVVLATLLARPNQPVSVDALMDSLWGDAIPASGPGTLQWHVHQLRKRLGQAERVSFGSSAYTLHIEPNESDAARFESALDTSFGDDSSAFDALERGLALWRGDAFGSLAEHRGVRAEARRLDQRRIAAHERHGELGLRRGEHAALIPELAGLAWRFPDRERFRALLMLALHRAGRRAEALDVYRQAREHLARELGREPGAELRELERAILNDDPALRPRATGVSPPRRPTPAELPTDLACLAGRGAELEILDGWLRPQPHGPTVVAIDGTGGMGKSTVAIRAAHLAKRRFPDGQLYINLRGTAPDAPPVEPAEALRRLLRSLGVTDADRVTDADELGNRFRGLSAERRLLMVLDDAREAAQVRPLLPSGPGCVVLVTSRRRLVTLPNAEHIGLERLSGEESRVLLDGLAGGGPAPSASSDVEKIVEWCDGMPLALTICGARLRDVSGGSVSALARRLADARHRLSEMEVDDLAVRASLQVSYDELLGDPGGRAPARLFRLLGLHDGPDLGLDAAAALADAPPAQTRGLLDVLTRARLVDEHQPGRFRRHDLVHLYAKELAAAEPETERHRALRRMLESYRDAALVCHDLTCPGSSAPFLRVPPGLSDRVGIGSHAEALNWIDGELANITAAVGACPAAEGLPEVALILTVAASVVVSNYRGAADAVILCRDMVAVADRYRDRAVAARANEALGTALVKAGQAVRARRALLRARDLRRGDPAEEAGPLALLALVASNLGDLDAAERYADEAVEIGTRAGQWANVAVALIQKALVREAAGDRDIALDTMRRAAATAADVGHGYAQAMAIAAAASILRRAGLHDAAIRAHGEALELDDAHGLTDTAVHADRLWGMAQSCYAAREPQRARRLWDRAADILLRRDVIGPKDYDTILATTPPPPLQDVDRRDAARR